MRHSIQGWAFGGSANEVRFRERFAAIADRRSSIVHEQGPSHAQANYLCRDFGDLTPEDLAILCDSGNVCFGGYVDVLVPGKLARVGIWTD